jgi:fluoroquinolone transport system ATP-binding protein
VERVIDVDGLRYRYPSASSDAIGGMTFDVRAGEVFGFLGPSGAGKTTTQRILIGLVDSWTGHAEVLGRPRGEWGSELFDRIGVSFELPVGYPRLTALEDLEHFGRLHDVDGIDGLAALDAVGLAGAAHQLVSSLSKGMRKRLNLARSMLHRPELLFLDEPTSGLDPINANQVRRIIDDCRNRGQTVFLTTHDMATAAELCDRVAFVVDGRIAACDTPRALRLRFGARTISVEHWVENRMEREVFDDATDPRLADLLASPGLQTVHSSEATLDEVFVAITGTPL